MKNHPFRLGIICALILMAALVRLFPHPPNFTPIGAIALFAGASFSRRSTALGVPFIAMLLSDALLQLLVGWGFHAQMIFVYGSFGAITLLGTRLQHVRKWGPIASSSLMASLLFFGVTNFGVWLTGGSYSHSVSGLIACFLAGVPFFGNTLAGDLFYSLLLFGVLQLADRHLPILAERAG